jgi:hypothetical protein
MQAMHLNLTCGVGFDEVMKGSEPGVIDQESEVWRGSDAFAEGIEVGRIGEVGCQEFGGDAVLVVQLAGQGAEAVLTARYEEKIVTLRGKLAGEGRSDAGGGPGDDSEHE